MTTPARRALLDTLLSRAAARLYVCGIVAVTSILVIFGQYYLPGIYLMLLAIWLEIVLGRHS